MLNVHFRFTETELCVDSDLVGARAAAAAMSLGLVTLQAQVESVLGSLVKAASVELVKLFESRYREVGRTGGEEDNKPWESLDGVSNGDSKRSVGVQVEKDISLEFDSTFLLDVGCWREPSEVEEFTIPSEILLAEESHHDWVVPLKEQIVAETLDMVESSVLQLEAPADSAALTEDIPVEADPETSRCRSTQSSPAKQKLLVITPDTSDASFGEKVKFVCPLILKSDSSVPKPDHSEEPVQAEPQQACVSTASGTAYSPSLSDGAVTPNLVGVWERIHPPKETKNHLQMKLKFTSLDQKLLQPCGVQLVDMLSIPESEVKTETEGGKAHNHKSTWPLPKDVRRHQGPHTGHRLCCFTRCEDGIWRLRKIVTHSRDGYVCNSCGKAFKRRKILRRHERFHTGEKPYSCSVCTKTFALRKSLRRHVRFHTGERPHTCSQCSKTFRLRDNLKAHLRFHSGEKPFTCATCGKMFRILRNLERHKLSRCENFVSSFRTIAGLKCEGKKKIAVDSLLSTSD